jgi:hypothetical protein
MIDPVALALLTRENFIALSNSKSLNKFFSEIDPDFKKNKDYQRISKIFAEKIKLLDRQLISSELIKSISELDKISYKDDINDFTKKFESSDEDLNKLILELLKTLWVKKYGKEEAFNRFGTFENYEKILLRQPHYRDHFIHQFQVFLCGLPIINHHYENVKDPYLKVFPNEEINIEFAWLLAASYHDVGYLIQLINTWMNSFFVELMEIPKIPFDVDLNRILLERNFNEYIDKIVSLNSNFQDSLPKPWKYSEPIKIDNEIRKEFLSKLLYDRNHGLFSSLILLDRIQNSEAIKNDAQYIDTTFTSTVMPAALAIALHDKSIFSCRSMKNSRIDFSRNPLAFTLIFCDTLQEWGRPGSSVSSDSSPRLTKYEISDKKISATLTYEKNMEIDYSGEKTTAFDLKEKEINEVFTILQSDNINFEISLICKDKKHHRPKTSKSTAD